VTAQFFWVPPIISGTGKATKFKFGRYSQGPCEQNPIKIFGKRSVGVSRDCRNFISGTGRVKLRSTDFKFCTHILSIDRNKSPLQISGKVATGVVRTLEIFQGTYILGASRGRLCDSSAFLFLLTFCLQSTCVDWFVWHYHLGCSCCLDSLRSWRQWLRWILSVFGSYMFFLLLLCWFLADRTTAQYCYTVCYTDMMLPILASSCRLSVRPSVRLSVCL